MLEKKTFDLTKKQVEYLTKVSKQSGISIAEVLRRILDEYIKNAKNV